MFFNSRLLYHANLVGVHDVDQAAQEEADMPDKPEDEEAAEEEYDSGGSGVALTPPDSPNAVSGRLPSYMNANGSYIDPEKDIYAIPSRASSQKREIYFLALVDILTQYGVKKQAAKVAKSVKYGAKDAERISTVEPDQYAARFLEFMSNAIEWNTSADNHENIRVLHWPLKISVANFT